MAPNEHAVKQCAKDIGELERSLEDWKKLVVTLPPETRGTAENVVDNIGAELQHRRSAKEVFEGA